MRVKITLSYDGSQFHGFQIQKDGTHTVANKLQRAFISLGIKGSMHASGRTDTGVHATAQVIDIDLPEYWSKLPELKKRLNHFLLPDIYIKKIEPVSAAFHARFSAKKRLYRYLLKAGEPSVFASPYLLYHDKIDLPLLERAARLYEGEHDFAYFMKQGSDVGSTVRQIYKCRFYRYKDLYVFSVEGSGFLRSQIRMMVDFLLKINDGALSIEDLQAQIDKKKWINRSLAKPNGLYLAKIKY